MFPIRLIAVFSIAFLGAMEVTSTKPLKISAYLSTAFIDYSLKPQQEKIDFLKASSSNTPLFNEVELRTRTNRFELGRQRYMVRLSPNGFGEAKQGKRVFNATLQFNKLQYQDELNDALEKRYRDVLALLFLSREYELSRQLALIYDDRLTVLKKQVTTLDFMFNDLVTAEDKDIDLQLDIINLENDIATLKSEMSAFLPVGEDALIDTSGLVSLEDIIAAVKDMDSTIKDDNLHLKIAQKEMEMDEARFKLEKAENRDYISYLEARYDAADSEEPSRAFSTGFGVRIPIVNPNRLDINRRKLAAIRSKTQYANKKRRLTENVMNLSHGLFRSLRQYELLMGKKQNSKAEASFKHFKGVEGVDPIILLKLKESMVKTDMALQKAKYRIYTKYIQLLDAHGRLAEKPFVNHLSTVKTKLQR